MARNYDGRVLEGTYGRSCTPCLVFEYEGWYCVEGSQNVNLAAYPDEELFDGVDVEEVYDVDCFTAPHPIESLEELIGLVDEDEEEDEDEE